MSKLDIESNSLSRQFSKELISPSIDLTIDYSEIFLDDFIENKILSEIPIIKSVVGVVKAGISINNFWFAKKLLTFIKEVNSGDIDEEKRRRFNEKIYNDEKFGKRVTEQIFVFLDRFLDINKSKISAQLFKSYVADKISFNEFISLNIYLERIHPDSYKFLFELEPSNFNIDANSNSTRDFENETLLLTSGLAIEPSDFGHGFKLTENGIKLFQLGIKPIRK